jgi:DNA polymerase alpha subunit A
MDNGMDDWEQGEGSQEEDWEDDYGASKTLGFSFLSNVHLASRRSKDKKPKKKGKKEKRPRPDVDSTPDISAYRPVVNEEKESDFMASLLQSMEAGPATGGRSRPPKRKSGAAAPSNFTAHRRPTAVIASSSDPVDPWSDVPSLSSGARNRRGAHPSSDSAADQWGNGYDNEMENFSSPAKKARLEPTAVTSKLSALIMPEDDAFYDSFYTDEMAVDDMPAVVKQEPKGTHLLCWYRRPC